MTTAEQGKGFKVRGVEFITTQTAPALAVPGNPRKGIYNHVGCHYSTRTRWHYAVDLKIFASAYCNVVFHGLMWFVLKVHIYFFHQWFCF